MDQKSLALTVNPTTNCCATDTRFDPSMASEIQANCLMDRSGNPILFPVPKKTSILNYSTLTTSAAFNDNLELSWKPPPPIVVGLGQVQPNRLRGQLQLQGGVELGQIAGGGQTSSIVHLAHFVTTRGVVKSNMPMGRLQGGGGQRLAGFRKTGGGPTYIGGIAYIALRHFDALSWGIGYRIFESEVEPDRYINWLSEKGSKDTDGQIRIHPQSAIIKTRSNSTALHWRCRTVALRKILHHFICFYKNVNYIPTWNLYSSDRIQKRIFWRIISKKREITSTIV